MIPFPPDDAGKYRGEFFLLSYWQDVCRIRRQVEYVRPVRLTGAEFVRIRVEGRERMQERLFLFFDFGSDSCGWAVNIRDIVSLTPVAKEAKQ